MLTGTFRLGLADSQDERGMFLRDSDIGFHGWTVLQPGGRNVNTHGRGENYKTGNSTEAETSLPETSRSSSLANKTCGYSRH